MTRRIRWHPAGIVLLASLAAPVAATDTGQATPGAPEGTHVDAAAVAALDRMGRTLRGLTHFTVTTDTTSEVVLEDGQKIELEGEVLYRAQPPRHLFVDMKSDRTHRQLFYDGDTLTLYSPRLKYYASVEDTHATLAEMATTLSTEYGIELPLADLFLWGTDAASRDALVSALYVGAGTLEGGRVDHYAYRQPGVAWQVWIDASSFLPRKIVITSLDDPALPAYSARLRWETKRPVDATAFTFKPPEDSARIALVEVDVVAVRTGEE